MSVANNEPATGSKKPGGVTGKGFVKGKSGNPTGRPKALFDFAQYVRDFLHEPDLNRGDQGNKLRTVTERMAKEDPKTLLAYGYGKPLDTVQLQGPDGQPLNPLAGLTVVIEGGTVPEKKE